MAELEKILEDFRPSLVIVDSLRRINHGSTISENSAEFADNIYTLKEMLGRYGAAGILIHHSNKDPEATGVHKLRGSSAIAGAVWGTWQLDHLPKPDPNNKKKLIIDPKDPNRVLSVFARDTEGQTIKIELDLEDNSWKKLIEGEADSEQVSMPKRIISILEKNDHTPGLSGAEIIKLLGMTSEEGRGVYTALNRMVNKRIISCCPAPGDKRYNIYSLPKQNSDPSAQHEGVPSPPPLCVPNVEYCAETLTQQDSENTKHNTQHLLNIF